MDYPKIFDTFEVFKELKKNGYFKSPYTGDELYLTQNILNGFTIKINQKEYPSFFHENKKEWYRDVILPVMEKLEKIERVHIFNENFSDNKLFKSFILEEIIKSDSFSSSVSEYYAELHVKLYDEMNDELLDFHELEELEDQDPPIDVVFDLYYEYEDNDYSYEIFNWQKDPGKRISFLTGAEKHDNFYVEEHLLDVLTIEEAYLSTDSLSEFNAHYSTFSNNEFAFDIKVYEDFAHPKLLDLKVLSYDDEGENRSHEIRSFVEDLQEYPELGETKVVDWSIDGKGGGYLILQLSKPTSESLLKINEMVKKAKETSFKHYQTLEAYEYMYDFILFNLKEKLEEVQDAKNLQDEKEILELISEINKQINNSV